MTGENEVTQSGSWRPAFDVGVQLAMIIAAGVIVYVALENRADQRVATSGKQLPTVPLEPVSLAGAFTQGSANAALALVVFSDFECPYCARFAKETLPEINRSFVAAGKVLVAFRHMPLESIHPLAKKPAESALCAGHQGKFWEMHDRIFQANIRSESGVLESLARDIGLDRKAYGLCITNGKVAAQVEADILSAKALGISGTPAFLVGVRLPDGQVKATEWLTGARPFSEFKTTLDRALRTVQP